VNAIKERIAELIDELFSFVSFIVFMAIEALVLFTFAKLHVVVHDILDHSPWCPMSVAAMIMNDLFLWLNVLFVIAFTVRQSRAIIRNVTLTAAKNTRRPGAKAISRHGKEARHKASLAEGEYKCHHPDHGAWRIK